MKWRASANQKWWMLALVLVLGLVCAALTIGLLINVPKASVITLQSLPGIAARYSITSNLIAPLQVGSKIVLKYNNATFETVVIGLSYDGELKQTVVQLNQALPNLLPQTILPGTVVTSNQTLLGAIFS